MSQAWPIREFHSLLAPVNGSGVGQVTQVHMMRLNPEIFLGNIRIEANFLY